MIHYNNRTESESNGHCKKCGYEQSKQRGVVKSCLDCFLEGHRLYRFEYSVSSAHFTAKRSGTCYTGSCGTPDIVVRRANKMLNDNNTKGSTSTGHNLYNLFENNNVCFAVLCMTGSSKSAREVAAKSKAKMVINFLQENYDMISTLAEVEVPPTEDDCEDEEYGGECEDASNEEDEGGEYDEAGDEEEENCGEEEYEDDMY